MCFVNKNSSKGGADADQDLFVMVFRFGGVEVLAIQAYLSITIGFISLITADIKLLRRKVQEVLPVLLEKFGDHSPFLIVSFSGLLLMFAQKSAVVFFDVMVRRHWNKQISPGRSDLVFDVPFLVSRIRITEADLKAVMSTEAGKEFCLMDLIHDSATDTGCVIEYKKLRYTADVVEDIHQPLADTLRCLSAEHLAVTIIAVRE